MRALSALLFLIGMMLILLSILLPITLGQLIPASVVDVAYKFLQSLGVALMIGAVFDLTINTTKFTKYVSEKIQKIVTSKNFLSDLGKDDKKEALQFILKPPEKVRYSNINDYFDKQIDKSLMLFETNFRSNLSIHVDVYKHEGIIKAKSMVSFRAYKVKDKYEKFTIRFHKDKNKHELLNTRIITYDGSESIEPEYSTRGLSHLYSFEVPEKYNELPFLTISREYIESGYEDVLCFDYSTITPSDGVDFRMILQEGLEVRECMIFDKSLTEKRSEHSNDLMITSQDWLYANAGFVVLVCEKIKNFSSSATKNPNPVVDDIEIIEADENGCLSAISATDNLNIPSHEQ